MKIRAIGVRLAVFFGVLGLTLLPGLIVEYAVVNLDGIRSLLGYPLLWQILAKLPVGIARVPFDGEIYFSHTSQLVALTFWLLVGLATAAALQRLRLRYFAAVSFVVILGSGIGAHLLMGAFGYAMYMSP